MIHPTSEAELADAVASASGALRIQGGGTRPIGNPVTGEALTTSGMSGITLYEPGALTLVAKTGTSMADIDAALDAENQMLPFEPMDHRALLGTDGTPTIGGVVAANVSGPRRVQAGACRDSLLGVRFVNGEGTVIKNGGRVMKNVTGYDLVKLMAGSYGTLGVISEVSFKVLPKPDTTATLVFLGADWSATTQIFSKAMGSPFEVSGAARLPAGSIDDAHGAVLLRLNGFEASVKYRAEALSAHLTKTSGAPDRVITDPAENAAIWKSVRDVESLAKAEGDIWRLAIKPTDSQKLGSIAGQESVVLDWAGGLVWISVEPGTDVRAQMDGIGGHATLMRASNPNQPAFHPEVAPLAKLARDLRAKFDPKGILNPGLMG
jgi:glycolate oxidase FAD binding subunit